MNLMEQCRRWNENDEYQNIVDAIEALPKKERTPELDSELARAYNNLAGVEDRELFKKAIALLAPHEAYFEKDHSWNFRMGYAYYYLDQEGPALHYFKRALEALPGDEDTREFIEDCRKRLSMPTFAKNFRERTAEGWAAFEESEAELRQFMDRKDQEGVAEQLIDRCKEALSAAFDDVSFELGFNGRKYELILTPEGDWVRLYELVYFKRHAPASLLERWDVLVGRQPSKGFELRSLGQNISAQDIRVWVERGTRKRVALTLYCEKLLPFLREERGNAWWILSNITDQVLGEIPAMAFIERFEVADAPLTEPSILLAELPGVLEDMGFEPNQDPEVFLENSYSAYELEPDKDPEADWRMDVYTGVTRCPALINEYLAGEGAEMDALHRDGAVAGFICYPLEAFSEETERAKAVLDFRDALEEAILKQAGEDAVTFLGGATGAHCGYLDFIAWDLTAVLDAAADFLRESPLMWANFHTFRREAGTIRLVAKEPDGADCREAQVDEADCREAQADEESDGAVSFVGFVLLSEVAWDRAQFIRDLKAEWDIDAETEKDEDDDETADVLVFPVGDMTAAVSMMPGPVPEGEAEQNAANNYMWPEAVETAKAHRAHLMVAVLGKDADLKERGKLFVKLISCCCSQEHATGVYASGTVFEPRFYQSFAEMMKEDALPIFNWIWFGLYQTENGVSCYTYGMDTFGKDEMEVLDVNAAPSEVRDFLSCLVGYVLEYDVTLRDGETIGFSEEDKHAITRSEGVSLPGMTLKISYEP